MWPSRGRPSPRPGSGCSRRRGARSAAAPISLLSEPGGATVGARALEQLGEHVLGAGLARGAGEPTATKVARSALDHVPARRAERRQHVVDDDGRNADRPGRQNGGRAGRDTAAAKSWPSTRSPAEATKSPPGTTSRESWTTRSDDLRPSASPASAAPADDRRDLGEGEGITSSSLVRLDAPRSTCAVVEGRTTPAMSWPCLVALAGDEHRVSGRPPRATRGAIAAARSPNTGPGRRARPAPRPGLRRGSRRGPRCAGCRR